MLYWICPECGHECSPAIRECPTCSAAEKALDKSPEKVPDKPAPAPAREAILSLAQNVQPAPLSPARSRSEPARHWVAQEVLPVQSPLAPPALVAAKRPPVEFGLKTADLAPGGEIRFQAAQLRLPKAHEQSVEPAPSRRRSVAFVREALPWVNVPSELALAGLAQPGEVRPTPPLATNGTGAAPLDLKTGSLAFISSKVDLAGESLSEMLHALEQSAEELERAAVRAIQASFQDHPAELLLCPAQEIVSAPAPPAEQWMRSPKIVFTAKAPSDAAPATLAAGPQPPTLAGPCLPPQLQNSSQGRSPNQRLPGKRVAASTWMVSVLIIALFLGGGALLQYLSANRD